MDPDVEDPGREGGQPRDDDGQDEGRDRATPRSWVTSGLIAGVIVGASIVVSATINPMFGRAVHWDWVAGAAPVGFAALAVAFRRRWL